MRRGWTQPWFFTSQSLNSPKSCHPFTEIPGSPKCTSFSLSWQIYKMHILESEKEQWVYFIEPNTIWKRVTNDNIEIRNCNGQQDGSESEAGCLPWDWMIGVQSPQGTWWKERTNPQRILWPPKGRHGMHTPTSNQKWSKNLQIIHTTNLRL